MIKKELMNRKEFIGKGSRIFLLSLLLGGAGFLAGKGRINLRGFCKADNRCAGCALNPLCGEPQIQNPEDYEEQSI